MRENKIQKIKYKLKHVSLATFKKAWKHIANKQY